MQITVHSGGSLGYKGPEHLNAVRDGLVPMADILNIQQVGEAPLLGIEGVPFLVSDASELKELQRFARPEFDNIAAKFNQKILYTVPWPTQYLHCKVKTDTLDGLKNLKIRVPDRQAGDMVNALGMVSVLIPWGETVPALASGAVVGVTTSSVSGVDGKFWEFLKYFYRTNHVWSSQIVTVNNDSWKKIARQSPQGDQRSRGEAGAGFLEGLDRGRHRQQQAPGRGRHGADRSAAGDAEGDAREDRRPRGGVHQARRRRRRPTSSRSTRSRSAAPEPAVMHEHSAAGAAAPARAGDPVARGGDPVGRALGAIDALSMAGAWAAVFCILAILGLIVGEVAARNLFNYSIHFAWEFSAYFMGAASCSAPATRCAPARRSASTSCSPACRRRRGAHHRSGRDAAGIAVAGYLTCALFAAHLAVVGAQFEVGAGERTAAVDPAARAGSAARAAPRDASARRGPAASRGCERLPARRAAPSRMRQAARFAPGRSGGPSGACPRS